MNPSAVSVPHWFIALPVPDELRTRLAEISAALRGRLDYRKWTHAADYHITLVFLGAFPAAQFERLSAELEEVARRTEPFTLVSNDLGHFGRTEMPRVLWANVAGGLEPLLRLQNDVESRLVRLGHQAENRPYSPHITLARNYAGDASPQAVIAAVADNLTQQPVVWQANEMVLFASHPGNTPMYEPLARFPF